MAEFRGQWSVMDGAPLNRKAVAELYPKDFDEPLIPVLEFLLALRESEVAAQIAEGASILRAVAGSEDMKAGKITVAMIKPWLKSTTIGMPEEASDPERAEVLREAIGEYDLEVLMELTLPVQREWVRQFYGVHEDKFKSWKPRLNKEFDNFWDEYVAGMAGPITLLVLYDPEGNAITKWREAIGRTNPDEARQQEWEEYGEERSIRARFAKDVNNSVVHGSDSVQSAEAELNYWAGWLENLVVMSERQVAELVADKL